MSNYLTYPCQIMRITQRYDGQTSHLRHMTGNPKDYSLDEGCTDGGRDWIYCSCDALKVIRITGTRDSKHTNAIWLTSTSEVDLANGKKSIVTLQFVHPNDDDLLKIKEGHIFHRGDKICREGNDGASGIHLHVAVGLGFVVGNGWIQNSKGAWVLTTTGGAIKPEDAFYIDPKFTTVVNSAGLKFKELPTKKDKYPVGEYKVVENAFVRSGAGTSYPKKKFTMFTEGAREQIKSLNKGKAANYFVPGVEFTAKKVVYDGKHYWGECPSGWVCLEHCKKVS